MRHVLPCRAQPDLWLLVAKFDTLGKSEGTSAIGVSREVIAASARSVWWPFDEPLRDVRGVVMLIKLLSVKAVASGVVLSVIALVFCWPLNGLGSSVALMAFVIGAGGAELILRLLNPRAPKASDTPAGEK